MKRLLCLILALAMSLTLCACGCDARETTAPSTTTENTTELTTAPSTSTVTTPPAQDVIRHPLNGAVLDAPWTGRAIAVIINNIEYALPQYGISQADLLYEIESEGGITRMLALFSDLSDVQAIGPVRSARTYFVNLVTAHGVPLAHCGGSVFAKKNQYDQHNALESWDHLDQMSNASYFYRDYDRYNNQGYAWEHTLFTTGENLSKAMEDKGFNKTYENGQDHGLRFDETAAITGQTANVVTIKFQGSKTTTMTYDPETKLYTASEFGNTIIDANDNSNLTFNNVLALQAVQTKGDGGRSFYDLIGSGDGMYACGGQIVPIKWSRPDLHGPISYTLADGTELKLQPGTTYVGIANVGVTPSYE